ncbi:MAG TPA: Ig-like domain-containing protein [Microvirga sp.]|jgi:VCBS repeat-containing protein|nr:Ig-like domain-containing protein [Microvirga sp.]
MSGRLGSAPVNVVPTQTFAVASGGRVEFGSLIKVSDADGDEIFVGLEAYNGTLKLGPDVAPGLITVGADNSGSIGLTGTSEAISAALDGLVYTHNGGGSTYGGFRITTDDPFWEDQDDVYVEITPTGVPSNQGPVNTVPDGPIYLSRHGSHDFGQTIQVSDEEDHTLRVILEVDFGTLTLGTQPGDLVVTEGEDGSIELVGSAADINVALDGLVYTSDGFAVGGQDALYIYTYDGEMSESGGIEDVDQVWFAIDTSSPNAPVNTVPTATIDLSAGDDYLFNSEVEGEFQVGDLDGGVLRVVVDAGGDSTLTLGDVSPDLIVSGEGGSRIEIEGSIADINDALDTLRLSPGEDFSGVVSVSTSDGFRTDRDQISFQLYSEGFDTAPVNTSPTHTLTLAPNGSHVFDGAPDNIIQVTDSDGGDLSVRLSVTRGTLSLALPPEERPPELDVFEDGSLLVLTGSQDDINTALIGLTYQHQSDPPDGYDEELQPVQISIETSHAVSEGGSYTDFDNVFFNIAIEADPVCASIGDTAGDDSFPSPSGQIATNALDPAFSLACADPSPLSGYDLALAGSYGTLHLDTCTGDYLYVPDDGAIEALKDTASDVFTVTIRDGGFVAQVPVTIELHGVDDRPEGAGDSYSVGQGEPLEVTSGAGVLANDSDRDDTALVTKLVDGPAHGTLVLKPNGSFTYVPDPSFSGTDSFTYQAKHGALESDPTTVTIEVRPKADPGGSPQARDDQAFAVEDPASLLERVVSGSVLANDSDPDAGDRLRVTALEGRPLGANLTLAGLYGTLTLREDGTYDYTLGNTDALIAGETGIERFTYTVADEAGHTATAVLTVAVAGSDLKLARGGSFSAHRGHDEITGDAGDDRTAGRGGDDRLDGGAGDDTLWGEDGADALFCGFGHDRAVGGAGDDVIWLGEGDDQAWGEAGRDAIHGEAGDDAADGGGDDDVLILGSGDDRGWGGLGNDQLSGEAGHDYLAGGAGDDLVVGQTGNDRLWGEDGDDALWGGAGADQFNGGAGEDRLFFDGGNDTAWGGGGNDIFVVLSRSGQMRIKDFQSGDTIELDGIFRSYARLEANMKQVGGDLVIDLPRGGGTLTVEKTDLLGPQDFSF